MNSYIPLAIYLDAAHRIILAIHIWTHRVVLLRQRINGRPSSGAVVEPCAEIGVCDAEGSVLLLLAGEAPAVRSELGQAVGVTHAEGIVVVLLDHCSARIDDGPLAAQMVGDVVIHRIGRSALADASAAEGHALEGLRSAVAAGVGEGTSIILPGACGSIRRGLRPVGEVCVVGFHGGPGLDLCRQVKQIVGRLQGIGGVGSDVAVDIVGECAAAVAGIGVRQGGSRADALAGLGPGPGGDVAGLLKNRRRPIAY